VSCRPRDSAIYAADASQVRGTCNVLQGHHTRYFSYINDGFSPTSLHCLSDHPHGLPLGRLEIAREHGRQPFSLGHRGCRPRAGRDLNDLYLRDDSGRWMGVGGGPDRNFVSFSGGPEGPLDEVVAANAGPGAELVMIGGPFARIDRKRLLPGGCRDPLTARLPRRRRAIDRRRLGAAIRPAPPN
jgi:hypothetical protein